MDIAAEIVGRKAALELVKREVDRVGSSRVAKKLGVAESAVRFWRDGQLPSKRSAGKIFESFSGSRAKQDQKAVSPSPTSPPTAPVEKGEVIVVGADDPRENAVATLRILRRALENAASEQIPSLANAVTSSSRLLARLSGALDVTEAQVLRSAAWAKLVKVVKEVLEAFPGAPAALDKAMAEYEARA